MLGSGDCSVEFFVGLAVPSIEPVITCHLEMFFGDMLDEEGNEIQYGNRFLHIGIILMFIVVESHMLAIVRINA